MPKSVAMSRAAFNEDVAPKLAAQVGPKTPVAKPLSRRFAFFASPKQLTVVAGPQEEGWVQLALVYGLSAKGNRRLVLVLPRGHNLATRQRVPWLAEEHQPTLYEHDGVSVERLEPVSRSDTIQAHLDRLGEQSPGEELRSAATPAYLGHRRKQVAELVEWATENLFLDSAHRRQERSWHCFGQRVLSIRSTKAGLSLRAGIHATKPSDAAVKREIGEGSDLTGDELQQAIDAVEGAILERISGARCRPDEHWLQSVLRHDPGLVGVEQPALRELPAWRPHDKPTTWGRGYLDLVGLDGQGDVRIVETKLGPDDLLTVQGLDYYVWAQAYREVLCQRLGAPDGANSVLQFVVGAPPGGEPRVSEHALAVARLLDLDHRFDAIYDWFQPPVPQPHSESIVLEQP